MLSVAGLDRSDHDDWHLLYIKAVIGLRVSEEEEIVGLDSMEHGLAIRLLRLQSIMDISNTMTMDVNENTDLGTPEYAQASTAKRDAAVKVVSTVPKDATGMYKVVIIAKLSRYDHLKKAMNDLGVTGMTCTQVMGCGIQKGSGERYRGAEVDATLLPKIKVEVVVSKIPCRQRSGCSKEGTLYRTYRRWKDLRIRCGKGCQDSYR